MASAPDNLTAQKLLAQIAVRLNDTLIQPRLETLASYFSNASLTDNESVGRCACWFGYCERFPVSTRVTFAVEHDTRFEKVAECVLRATSTLPFEAPTDTKPGLRVEVTWPSVD